MLFLFFLPKGVETYAVIHDLAEQWSEKEE